MSRSAEDIASDIRRYCVANPHARDSIDGIAWWLVLQRFEDARAQLRDAVDALVRQGVLEAHTLADGTVLFACTTSFSASPDAEPTSAA